MKYSVSAYAVRVAFFAALRRVLFRLLMCAAIALMLLSAAVSEAEARKWTDSTGKHSVEAKLLEVVDGRVRLEKPDGTIVSIALKRLSRPDQKFVRDQQQAAPTENVALSPLPGDWVEYAVTMNLPMPGMPIQMLRKVKLSAKSVEQSKVTLDVEQSMQLKVGAQIQKGKPTTDTVEVEVPEEEASLAEVIRQVMQKAAAEGPSGDMPMLQGGLPEGMSIESLLATAEELEAPTSGEESIKVGRRKFNCRWTEHKYALEFGGQKVPVASKEWATAEVPLGGLVKIQQAFQVQGMPVTMVTELSGYERGKAASE